MKCDFSVKFHVNCVRKCRTKSMPMAFYFVCVKIFLTKTYKHFM